MSPKHPELVSKCSSWWYFEIPLWTELGVGSILVITCGFTALCRQQRNFIHRKKSVSTGKMVMSKGVSHEPLPTIDIDPRWSPSQIHQSYCLGSFCYGEGFSFLFGYNQEKHDLRKTRFPLPTKAPLCKQINVPRPQIILLTFVKKDTWVPSAGNLP